MPDRTLKYRELRRILARFGVEELPSRGKGSHRMFSAVVGGRLERYPVPCHSEGDELSAPLIRAARRRFRLTPEFGVSDERFYGA